MEIGQFYVPANREGVGAKGGYIKVETDQKWTYVKSIKHQSRNFSMMTNNFVTELDFSGSTNCVNPQL